jgi:hypothetical protein
MFLLPHLNRFGMFYRKNLATLLPCRGSQRLSLRQLQLKPILLIFNLLGGRAEEEEKSLIE